MGLDQFRPGQSGIIVSVSGEGALRRRLLDMGLTPGTRVSVRKVAPFGDPLELVLRGYELTLRGEDARIIRMKKDPA
jgi:Fe2+ transport system protein FeoA